MKYKLIKESGEGDIITDVELTYYEFKQALIMHKRMAQRKDRWMK